MKRTHACVPCSIAPAAHATDYSGYRSLPAALMLGCRRVQIESCGAPLYALAIFRIGFLLSRSSSSKKYTREGGELEKERCFLNNSLVCRFQSLRCVRHCLLRIALSFRCTAELRKLENLVILPQTHAISESNKLTLSTQFIDA